MNLLISERGSGKTTYLLKESARNRIPILCPTRGSCERLKHIAIEHSIDIPDPIPYEDYGNTMHPSAYGKVPVAVYIDEIDEFFKRIGYNVVTATMTKM